MTDDDRTRREGALPRRPTARAHPARRRECGRRRRLFGARHAGRPLRRARRARRGRHGRRLRRVRSRARSQGRDQAAAGPRGRLDGGGDHKAWLVREAQALARLSHPNVVAVYDVGTLPDDQVFVAMELVDGVTLREWLKARAATVARGVAGPGRGRRRARGRARRRARASRLQARQRAGRHDGRVRVMDFGLARLGRARLTTHDDEPPPRDSRPSRSRRAARCRSSSRSRARVLGTPAYMAPEVYDGEPADARSDQFAFGVTLFEALYRARPYKRADLAPPGDREAAELAGERERARCPGALAARRRCARSRGIATQRYPSDDRAARRARVDPMRASGRRSPRSGSRSLAVGAPSRACSRCAARRRRELCTGADEAARRRVGRVRSSKQIADRVPRDEEAVRGARVRRRRARARSLHRTSGPRAVTESCEATRVRGEQTEEVLSLREACLDNHLDEVRALTALLGQADASDGREGRQGRARARSARRVRERRRRCARRASRRRSCARRSRSSRRSSPPRRPTSLAGHVPAVADRVVGGVIDGAKALGYRADGRRGAGRPRRGAAHGRQLRRRRVTTFAKPCGRRSAASATTSPRRRISRWRS